MANPGYTRIVGALAGTTYDFPASTDLQNRMIERCVLTCDTTLGPITINLPSISGLGGFLNTEILIIDIAGQAAVNNITVNANGTDEINGSASNVINTNGAAITYKIGSVDAPNQWVATIGNLTPSSAILSPFLTNLVYVDAVNGNNATAIPYRIDKPYATIAAAEAAAAVGDTIYVYPGLYAGNGLGTVSDINYYFCPGAVVAGNNIWTLNTGGSNTIAGSGLFDSAAGTCLKIDNGTIVTFAAEFIGAASVAVDVDNGSLLSLMVTGQKGILSNGNGVIINESIVGGTICNVVATTINAGATAIATVSPASDQLLANFTVFTDIISRNGTLDAFCINHVGGKLNVNGRCRKLLAAGGASAVQLHPAAGAAARLNLIGDVICPSAGSAVNFASGIGTIRGDIHGGTISLGGGSITIADGSGIHRIIGDIIGSNVVTIVTTSGTGVLYHDGRIVNKLAGSGYLMTVDNSVILRGGNSIVTAGAVSIDDGGAGFNVLLYGVVVTNVAAAGTVVAAIGTLTVNAAVVG